MVFSSLVFLFHFLPLFLLLYYICPAKWKNAVLFAGSLIFYIYGVKMSLVLFLISAIRPGKLPYWPPSGTAQMA